MELQKKNNIVLFSFFCFFVLIFLFLSVFTKIEVARSIGEPCGPGFPACPNNENCVDDGMQLGTMVCGGVEEGGTCWLPCPKYLFYECTSPCYSVTIGPCSPNPDGPCTPAIAQPDLSCTSVGGHNYICNDDGTYTEIFPDDGTSTYGCSNNMCVPNGPSGAPCNGSGDPICIAAPVWGCEGSGFTAKCNLNSTGTSCTSTSGCQQETPSYCVGTAPYATCSSTATSGTLCASDEECNGSSVLRCSGTGSDASCSTLGDGDVCTTLNDCIPPNPHCVDQACVFESGTGIPCPNGSGDCAESATGKCDDSHKCTTFGTGKLCSLTQADACADNYCNTKTLKCDSAGTGASCDPNNPKGDNYDCLPKYSRCSPTEQACIESTSSAGIDCSVNGDADCPCMNGDTRPCETCGGEQVCTSGVWGQCNYHRVCDNGQCKCVKSSGVDECSDSYQCTGETHDCDRGVCGFCGYPECFSNGFSICREYFNCDGEACRCYNGEGTSNCLDSCLTKCTPTQTAKCDTCGLKTCLADGTWDECSAVHNACNATTGVCECVAGALPAGSTNCVIGESCGSNPTVSNMQVTADLCSNTAFFKWKYNDVDGDKQTKYDLEIDDDANFNHPEVTRNINLIIDSGITEDQNVLVEASSALDSIEFGTNYYWRVKVSNEFGTNYYWRVKVSNANGESEWTYFGPTVTYQTVTYTNDKALAKGTINEGSKKTYIFPFDRPAPEPKFTANPTVAIKTTPITFTDESICYTINGYPDGTCTYLWDFGDGTKAATAGTKTKTYGTDGTYNVKLTACYEVDHCCEATPSRIIIGIPVVPIWKEVSPF